MPAVLYPGKDNIVRVGRQNARIDEGYNEVLVDNQEEFKQKFGSWLVPIECITNGEAFIIVRNNSSAPVRLNPGVLEISVKPTVALPRVLSAKELAALEKPSEITQISQDSVLGEKDPEASRFSRMARG